MDISPRLLEQFAVLAEEKHFGRAADRLSMRQPPLSQAIQRLERLLGVGLIDRDARGVRLTPAGRAFAADARQLLDGQSAAITRARRITAGTEGVLCLGFIGGLGYWHVPKLLSWAAQELPNLRFDLRNGSSDHLIELVRGGSVDLALVRGPVPESERLTVCELGKEDMAVALPAGHPVVRAGASEVTLADLRDDQFAAPGNIAMWDLTQRVRLACEQAGFTLTIGVHAEDLFAMLAHVASGRYVSLVPERTARLAVPGVRVLPLREPLPELAVRIAAVHRATADPAVHALLDLAVRHGLGPDVTAAETTAPGA